MEISELTNTMCVHFIINIINNLVLFAVLLVGIVQQSAAYLIKAIAAKANNDT